MIDDKVIEQLKAEGYNVHKKMDEKLLKRRNEIYSEIFGYIFRHCRTYGYYPYSLEQYAKDRVRKMMKKRYGTLNYQDISDELWPEVKQEMIEVATNYIDDRIREKEARNR